MARTEYSTIGVATWRRWGFTSQEAKHLSPITRSSVRWERDAQGRVHAVGAPYLHKMISERWALKRRATIEEWTDHEYRRAVINKYRSRGININKISEITGDVVWGYERHYTGLVLSYKSDPSIDYRGWKTPKPKTKITASAVAQVHKRQLRLQKLKGLERKIQQAEESGKTRSLAKLKTEYDKLYKQTYGIR